MKDKKTSSSHKKGLTPTELLIYSLENKEEREEISRNLLIEIKNTNSDPREEFNICLNVLKKKGLIAFLLIFQFIFSSNLFSSQISILVIPIHDGISDEISDDLANVLSTALAKSGLEVIPNDIHSALAQSKEHYFNFEYQEARAQIAKAIERMEKYPQKIPEYGIAFRNAYITAGIIEKSERGHKTSTIDFFRKAIILDPEYELDKKIASPSIIQLFLKTKKEILNQPLGSLNIETDPDAAEVYINGISKGRAPSTIKNLPVGNYIVTIKANKHKTVERQVSITADSTINMREKLLVKNKTTGRRDEIAPQLEEGLRIAEFLHASRVVMIDANEEVDNSGEIVVKMIDTKYHLPHNPIVIRYTPSKAELPEELAKAADILLTQVKSPIADDSQKNLNLNSDPIVLGHHSKDRLITTPTLLAIIGSIVIATAGGITAATLGGVGHDNSTGNLSVQFK